jgi:hypothetical protein
MPFLSSDIRTKDPEKPSPGADSCPKAKRASTVGCGTTEEQTKPKAIVLAPFLAGPGDKGDILDKCKTVDAVVMTHTDLGEMFGRSYKAMLSSPDSLWLQWRYAIDMCFIEYDMHKLFKAVGGEERDGMVVVRVGGIGWLVQSFASGGTCSYVDWMSCVMEGPPMDEFVTRLKHALSNKRGGMDAVERAVYGRCCKDCIMNLR